MGGAGLRRYRVGVCEVLEDVWPVGRGLILVEPIDPSDSWEDWFDGLRWIDRVNVGVRDIDSWFRGVLVSSGFLGGLAGRVGSSRSSGASIYKGGQRAST
jgi:hypothetical protein